MRLAPRVNTKYWGGRGGAAAGKGWVGGTGAHGRKRGSRGVDARVAERRDDGRHSQGAGRARAARQACGSQPRAALTMQIKTVSITAGGSTQTDLRCGLGRRSTSTRMVTKRSADARAASEGALGGQQGGSSSNGSSSSSRVGDGGRPASRALAVAAFEASFQCVTCSLAPPTQRQPPPVRMGETNHEITIGTTPCRRQRVSGIMAGGRRQRRGRGHFRGQGSWQGSWPGSGVVAGGAGMARWWGQAVY